ncbi:MAG: bestrophin family ion channel, partial [Ensifer adhaerens]
MIVRDRPSLLKLFFILRGSVIQRIFPQVLFVFALSGGVVWAHQGFPAMVPSVNSGPFALLGIALSVFLGFRNNACYDRWWEARKDWGQLIFLSRDFARQTLILGASGAEGLDSTRARLLNLV